MLEHEAPENRDADLDEIGGGIVGLDQLIDAVGEELERSLREGIYEQALLRSEQRVHGSRAGSGCFGHGTDREGPGSALGDESLSCRAEGGAGLLVVDSRPTHLDIVAQHVTLHVT